MTKSQIFTKAHALARQTVQPGDSYQATFAICLRIIYQEQAMNQVKIVSYRYNDNNYTHEFVGNIDDAIAALENENAELQASIAAGKPARRRQPTIDHNTALIAVLRNNPEIKIRKW